MNKQHLFYVVILLCLLVISSLLTAYLGYQKSNTAIQQLHGATKAKTLQPFFKSLHYYIGFEGFLIGKGRFWVVENKGDKMSFLISPELKVLKGKAFSGEDFPNWQGINLDSVKVGDYLILPAFYNPADKYAVPTVIFVKIK